jgi:CRP-like cAMP-binding protein
MLGQTVAEASLLGRLRDLATLSTAQFKELVDTLSVRAVEKGLPICGGDELREHAYILLSGAVAITCTDFRRRCRKLLRLISPGIIPTLPEVMFGLDCDLRYEAFTNCKVAKSNLDVFAKIMLGIRSSEFRNLLDIHLRNWMAVFLRSSKNAVGLAIRERVALTLLELCSDFGIPESRGMLLALPIRHDELADLSGTTRSKVTHVLGDFERRGMIIRTGRRLVIRQDRLAASLRDRQQPLAARRSVSLELLHRRGRSGQITSPFGLFC